MKKTIAAILLFIGFISFTPSLFAQAERVNLEDWSKFKNLNIPYQEKVYMHFDKPYYVAGDRMWFRGYLVDACTHKIGVKSTILIAELYNSSDSLISRQKVFSNDSVFFGCFLLNDSIAEGTYTVRAYTQHMQNFSESYFYHRQFHIGNSITSLVKTSIEYKFLDPKKGEAQVSFKLDGKPLAEKTIDYIISVGGKERRRRIELTDLLGNLLIKFNPMKIKGKNPILTVYFKNDSNLYSRSFIIPSMEDIDVQFFPEGGQIIKDATNVIGFKATNYNGLAAAVEGTLYDSENKKVCTFKSSHLGMGKFAFSAGLISYYAIVTTPDGVRKRIDLPKAQKEQYGLAVTNKFGHFLVSVRSEGYRYIKDTISLIAHSRGTVFYEGPMQGFNPSVLFEQRQMRAGIVNFVLVDKNRKPLSERIAFVPPNQMTSVIVDFKKALRAHREIVRGEIIARDRKELPMVGACFSVSVTDASDVALDPSNDNIINNLLLSSDIKGYVEKPGLYFNGSLKNPEEALDLLMLTQGWRRFSNAEALTDTVYTFEHKLENDLKITGQVGNPEEKKTFKGVNAYISAPSINYFDVQEVNDSGKFVFPGLTFGEQTEFIVHARKKKASKKAIDVLIDEEMVPNFSTANYPADACTPITETYLLAARYRYLHETSKGKRGVYVTKTQADSIIKKRSSKYEYVDYQYAFDDYLLEGYKLEKEAPENLLEVVKQMPGMRNWNEKEADDVKQSPIFVVDGEIRTWKELKKINMKDVFSIESFKTDARDEASSRQIFISFKSEKSPFDKKIKEEKEDEEETATETKTEEAKVEAPKEEEANPSETKEEKPNEKKTDVKNTTSYIATGYTKNSIFYQPKYETKEQKNDPTPDLRSTLHFEPKLVTQENGKVSFEFYTADRFNRYNFVVEGISAEGEVLRYEGSFLLLQKDKMYGVE